MNNVQEVLDGHGHRLWFGKVLPLLVAKLFTGHVRVTGGELVPEAGPVLFVGRHRAGLMDGWLYAHALPRPTSFVIAARLRRIWLRPLVAGIAIMRRKEGGDRTAANRAALLACRAELAAGRTLFIFPEGTSSLGPCPLPLEPGAALLARAVPGTAVVPVAIHYADPVRLGTGVAITFGAPHYLQPAATVEQAQTQLARMLGSLPNERLAGPATIGSFADAPVQWLATRAGQRLADDDTAVLTWATMLGLPMQVFWSAGLVAACFLAGQGWLAGVYGVLLAARLLRPTEHRRA